MVWDAWCGVLVNAAIQRMLKIVRDKIGGLEEQVDVVGTPTLHVVRSSNPSSIFGSRPVQFWNHLASQSVDGGGDLVVNISPPRGDILLGVIAGVGVAAVVSGGRVRCGTRQNNAI